MTDWPLFDNHAECSECLSVLSLGVFLDVQAGLCPIQSVVSPCSGHTCTILPSHPQDSTGPCNSDRDDRRLTAQRSYRPGHFWLSPKKQIPEFPVLSVVLVNESGGSDIGSSEEATGGLFCSISDCGGGIT